MKTRAYTLSLGTHESQLRAGEFIEVRTRVECEFWFYLMAILADSTSLKVRESRCKCISQ